MKPEELFREFVGGFEGRKFSAGLLVAFIDFLGRLGVPGAGFEAFEEFLERHPRQFITSAGKRANTLIVEAGGGDTLSLRPFYNAAERFFRVEHKRFDYPSCAPHATQAWADYLPWLDALISYTPEEMEALRRQVCDFVLRTLKSHEFDPSSVRFDPPLFRILLEDFDLTAKKGEPTGAAFQGVVFGFLRADNPHLQVEINKVRTGSKRLQRIGDIDAWDGDRLAISAEVKQFKLKLGDVPDLHAFANETGRRGALGIICALEFDDDAWQQLEGLGLKALDLDDLIDIVQLWDPLKQRTAVSSFVYYVKHVEMNSALAARLDAFLKKAKEGAAPAESDGPRPETPEVGED